MVDRSARKAAELDLNGEHSVEARSRVNHRPRVTRRLGAREVRPWNRADARRAVGVTTEDGQTYYHNTVTDETSWTRPGSEVEEALLTTYTKEEMGAWVREWSETGETTIPKGLKRACKQLSIEKSKCEEWLRLRLKAQKQPSKAAERTGRPRPGVPTTGLRRSQTMGTTTMRSELMVAKRDRGAEATSEI